MSPLAHMKHMKIHFLDTRYQLILKLDPCLQFLVWFGFAAVIQNAQTYNWVLYHIGLLFDNEGQTFGSAGFGMLNSADPRLRDWNHYKKTLVIKKKKNHYQKTCALCHLMLSLVSDTVVNVYKFNDPCHMHFSSMVVADTVLTFDLLSFWEAHFSLGSYGTWHYIV